MDQLFKHLANQLQGCFPLGRKSGEKRTMKKRDLEFPEARSFRFITFLAQYNALVHYWGGGERGGSMCIEMPLSALTAIEEIGIQKHCIWHWETKTQGWPWG